MKTKHDENPMILQLVSLLLLLTLLSINVTSGLFARYTVKGEADDTARVATFDVTASSGSSTDVSLKLSVNDYGTYLLNVTNDSEVAVSYDVILTLNAPLPAGTSVEVNGRTASSSSDGGRTLRFSDAGSLSALGSTNTNTIVFGISKEFAAPATGAEYTEVRSFDISVIITQID